MILTCHNQVCHYMRHSSKKESMSKSVSGQRILEARGAEAVHICGCPLGKLLCLPFAQASPHSSPQPITSPADSILASPRRLCVLPLFRKVQRRIRKMQAGRSWESDRPSGRC